MTRAPLLVLTLLPCLALARDPLHAELMSADAVVVAKVDRVEGRTAHLSVQKVLKGKVPAMLAVPKDTHVGCFADQAYFAADAVVVPVSRTERIMKDHFRQMIAKGEALPEKAAELDRLAKEAGERQEWTTGDPVVASTGELARLVAVIEQGLALPAPTEAWGLSLLKLRSTYWHGVDFFEEPGREIPAEARAHEARRLLSREVRLWTLERTLRWVANNPDPGLTRAAMDIVRAGLDKGTPGDKIEQAVTQIARRLDPKAADPVIPPGKEGWNALSLERAKARFAELEKAAATSPGR